MEEIAGTAVQTRYTFGTSVVSQTRNVASTPATSYYGYDAHGNITFLTDATGAVTDAYDYDAWGNVVASTGSTPNTRLYAGEELDPDLGLINLRARQYRAGTGRFLTIDPLDVEGGVSSPSASESYGARDRRVSAVRTLLELFGVDRGPTERLLTPVAWQRYLFANGDPVLNVDPSGLSPAIETGQLNAKNTPLVETIAPPRVPFQFEFPNTLTPGPESEIEFWNAFCRAQKTFSGKVLCTFLVITGKLFRLL